MQFNSTLYIVLLFANRKGLENLFPFKHSIFVDNETKHYTDISFDFPFTFCLSHKELLTSEEAAAQPASKIQNELFVVNNE